MLDDEEREKVVASPHAGRVLAAHVARPTVRLQIFAAKLIDSGPFAVLLFSAGVALLRLGGRDASPLDSALPWLRRGSLAAIAWAVGQPVSNSLMAAVLSPGTPSGGHWYVMFDLVDIGTALMLAVAAYATVWALEGGLKAQRELADFV